jgi:hypothetical protein
MGAGMLSDHVADTWSVNSSTRVVRLASDLTATFGAGGRQITIAEEIAHELAHAVIPEDLKQKQSATINLNPNTDPEEIWVRRRTGAVADDLGLPRPNNADSPLSGAIKINPEQSCTLKNPQGNGLSDGVLFLDGTRGYNGVGSALPPGAGSVDPARVKQLERGGSLIERLDGSAGKVVQSEIVGPDGSRATSGFDEDGNRIWSINQAADGSATPIAGNGNNVTTDDGGAPGALEGRLGSLLLNPTSGGSAFPPSGDLLGSLQRSLVYSGGAFPALGGPAGSPQLNPAGDGGAFPTLGSLQNLMGDGGAFPAPSYLLGSLRQPNMLYGGGPVLSSGQLDSLKRNLLYSSGAFPSPSDLLGPPQPKQPENGNPFPISSGSFGSPQPFAPDGGGLPMSVPQPQMTSEEVSALWNSVPIPPALRPVAAWVSRTTPQTEPEPARGTALARAQAQMTPQQVPAPGPESIESLLPPALRPLVRFFQLDDS